MDSSKMILTETVSPPMPLEKGNERTLARIISGAKTAHNNAGISEPKKVQAAKDFESLLLSRLLNEMKDSIGEWGFKKDGVSRQIQGIFWSYLARDMANNGGLGMWKQIYESINLTQGLKSEGEPLDSKI